MMKIMCINNNLPPNGDMAGSNGMTDALKDYFSTTGNPFTVNDFVYPTDAIGVTIRSEGATAVWKDYVISVANDITITICKVTATNTIVVCLDYAYANGYEIVWSPYARFWQNVYKDYGDMIICCPHVDNTRVYENNQNTRMTSVVCANVANYSYGMPTEVCLPTCSTESKASGYLAGIMAMIVSKFATLKKWQYIEILRRSCSQYANGWSCDKTGDRSTSGKYGFGTPDLTTALATDYTTITSFSGYVGITLDYYNFGYSAINLRIVIPDVPEGFDVYLAYKSTSLIPLVDNYTTLNVLGILEYPGVSGYYSFRVPQAIIPNGNLYFCLLYWNRDYHAWGRLEEYNIITDTTVGTGVDLVPLLRTITGGYTMAYTIAQIVTEICVRLNDAGIDKFSDSTNYYGRARSAFIEAFYGLIDSGQFTLKDVGYLVQNSTDQTIADQKLDLYAAFNASADPCYKLIDLLPGTNSTQIKLKEVPYDFVKTNVGNTMMSEFIPYYILGNVIYFPYSTANTKKVKVVYLSGKITSIVLSSTDVSAYVSMSFIYKAISLAVKTILAEEVV